MRSAHPAPIRGLPGVLALGPDVEMLTTGADADPHVAVMHQRHSRTGVAVREGYRDLVRRDGPLVPVDGQREVAQPCRYHLS